MKCPFNNCENEDDNINFDNPLAHLIITVGETGHTHIHGPFEDKFILKKMADALMNEMWKNEIDYTIPVRKGGKRKND